MILDRPLPFAKRATARTSHRLWGSLRAVASRGAAASLPVVASLCMVALLGACASSPPLHYYTLMRAPAGNVTPAATGPSVLVADVSVPEAVARVQMVVRGRGNVIEITDEHRWAEPLRTGIAAALADDLGRSLEARRASANPVAIPSPDWRVSVDVVRFDATLGEGVLVEALWIARPKQGDPISGRSIVRESVASNDHAAIASAFSAAVDRVATDIAASLRTRFTLRSPPRVA